MAVPLQDAAAKVARAARHAKRYPDDPTAACELSDAIEHLVAVRAARAVGDTIVGRCLNVDAQQRILINLAAALGANSSDKATA